MKKLILFELRKVFSKRLALIALIGIILFSALLSFSTFQNKYAFDGVSAEGSGKTAVEIDKGIAAKYEGILTDEKVQQMMNDFAPTHDLHGLNAMYLYQNATQSAAFSRFSDKEGNTPLIALFMYTIKQKTFPHDYEGTVQVIELLKQYGADVRHKNNEGYDALYYLENSPYEIDKNYYEIFKQLLTEKGK